MINKIELMNFLLGPFLLWLPFVVSLIIIFFAINLNIFTEKKFFRLKILRFLSKPSFLNYQKLTYIFLVFTLLFNSALTWLQYYVWHASAIGKFFFPPFQPISYFINYSFYHFWLPSLLNLVISALIVGIIAIYQRYNKKIISYSEAWLFLLVCLLASWPGILIFIPLFFSITLFSLIFSRLIFKKERINIFWGLIFSTLIVLLFSNYIMNFLNFRI